MRAIENRRLITEMAEGFWPATVLAPLGESDILTAELVSYVPDVLFDPELHDALERIRADLPTDEEIEGFGLLYVFGHGLTVEIA